VTQSIRYVTDVPYIASFSSELAPAFLDFVATLSGFMPPRRVPGEAFAYCELGCGQGMASIVFAATHPSGTFHGIDAMPEHIARGSRIAERAGIGNLIFHAMDFAAAHDLDLPKFQYIVAHGVYAWIDAAAKASMRRFIDRHLAPGGLVYVSYNAMPGWAVDMPFQHLIYTLATAEAGNSIEKFEAASLKLQELRETGAASLMASTIAAEMETLKTRAARAYFAHEYLAPEWRPLYVDEVRRDMAEIGLSPVGSASLQDNFDSFVLRKAAREALAEIEDPDLRELARDYFMNQRFRRDVYARDPRGLADDERRERLLDMHFALMRPEAMVKFATGTEAGELKFDNPVARRLVAMLALGPRRLGGCVEGDTIQDVIANTMALCCAKILAPVAAHLASVERLNAVLLDTPDAETETALRVLPYGTAMRFDRNLLKALRDGSPTSPEVLPWVDFLKSR
jgi:trans-aconitate methyltransferase